VGKIAESGLKECAFDNMALYFECRIIIKKRTPSDCCFGDFSHWEVRRLLNIFSIQEFTLNRD